MRRIRICREASHENLEFRNGVILAMLLQVEISQSQVCLGHDGTELKAATEGHLRFLQFSRSRQERALDEVSQSRIGLTTESAVHPLFSSAETVGQVEEIP